MALTLGQRFLLVLVVDLILAAIVFLVLCAIGVNTVVSLIVAIVVFWFAWGPVANLVSRVNGSTQLKGMSNPF